MENLILGFDGAVPSLAEIAVALARCADIEPQTDQLVVCERENCAFVRRQTRPERSWFDHWPPHLIPDSPQTLLVAYRDVDLAKRIVCALARNHRFIVDTDNDGVYTAKEFVQRATREPDWDWLREAWLAPPRRRGGPR
jgi:hypothetical protein